LLILGGFNSDAPKRSTTFQIYNGAKDAEAHSLKNGKSCQTEWQKIDDEHFYLVLRNFEGRVANNFHLEQEPGVYGL